MIPIEKAIDPFGDAILAYEMNNEELPRDHGYPVRLLAPGNIIVFYSCCMIAIGVFLYTECCNQDMLDVVM